jgi:bifunctional non-homologous end joining protein LigD
MIRARQRSSRRAPAIVSRKTLLRRRTNRIRETERENHPSNGVLVKSQALLDLPSERVPTYVAPMKCHLSENLPEGEDWLYELKLDGYRAVAVKNGPSVHLFSRTRNNLTDKFSEVAEAIQKLPCDDAILDGEIAALDEQGRTSFQLLQQMNFPGGHHTPVFYYVFDLLHLNGKNLRDLPLVHRQEILSGLLRKPVSPIRLSTPLSGSAESVMSGVKKLGLEGVIAKRRESTYRPGVRVRDWIKVKTVQQQEFVIGGYTPPEGARQFFGAIIVGYYENGKLLFASKVGTGFNFKSLKALYHTFQKLRREDCPFANLPEPPSQSRGGLLAREMRECSWIEPRLVCQIRFAEWTHDGHLRQPVFLGLREDKPPHDVRKEQM